MFAWTDLLAALCLVLILEGLFLFVAPNGWRQAVLQAAELGERPLRAIGGGLVIAGLLSLYFVRGG